MDRIPADLEAKMKLWRAGLTPMPKEYIEFHEKAALEASKTDFPTTKYTIHRTYSGPDGWCDGMSFIHLIVEDSKTNELYKVKWSDCGKWYSQTPSGGWGLFNPAKPQR